MSDSDNLVDFSKPWTYSDIAFIVEEKRVYASKMILSMWSPVFEAMFHDNFKEKNAKEISLPGKKFDAVIELMKVLHPPNKEICGEVKIEFVSSFKHAQAAALLMTKMEMFGFSLIV